jgi:hypothetical protein
LIVMLKDTLYALSSNSPSERMPRKSPLSSQRCRHPINHFARTPHPQSCVECLAPRCLHRKTYAWNMTIRKDVKYQALVHYEYFEKSLRAVAGKYGNPYCMLARQFVLDHVSSPLP